MNTTLALDKKNDAGLDSKIEEIVHKYEPEVGVFPKQEYKKNPKIISILKTTRFFFN